MGNIVYMERMGAIGGAILTLSILQIIVSSVAYGMTSWNVGSWWAGTLCCAAAVCALFSINRVAVIVGCVFSVAAAMATVAGIVVDAMSYNLTYTLDRCNNRYSGGIYDSLQYVDDAAVGAPYNSQEWVCVHGADASTCYLFRSQRARNCGSILTALPALLLLASMTLQILLFFMVLHYSLLTCMTLREDSQDGSAPPPHSVSVPDAHSGSTAPPPVVSTALAVPTEQTNVV